MKKKSKWLLNLVLFFAIAIAIALIGWLGIVILCEIADYGRWWSKVFLVLCVPLAGWILVVLCRSLAKARAAKIKANY